MSHRAINRFYLSLALAFGAGLFFLLVHPFVAAAIYSGNSTLLKCCVTLGYNLEERDDSRTALLFAVEEGNLKAVNTLLDAGADPNVRYRGGRNPSITALMVAAGEGYSHVCEALLLHGAEVNARHNGETALALTNRAARQWKTGDGLSPDFDSVKSVLLKYRAVK